MELEDRYSEGDSGRRGPGMEWCGGGEEIVGDMRQGRSNRKDRLAVGQTVGWIDSRAGKKIRREMLHTD